MNSRKKLSARQESEEQRQVQGHENAQSSAREFASVEELLRHDALHTPVPPAIAVRLENSVGQLPPPARSWWQRFFRGFKG